MDADEVAIEFKTLIGHPFLHGICWQVIGQRDSHRKLSVGALYFAHKRTIAGMSSSSTKTEFELHGEGLVLESEISIGEAGIEISCLYA